MEESVVPVAEEASRIVPRQPWLAMLLSLLSGGPIGQVYAGHLRRSVIIWMAGIAILFSLAIVLMFPQAGRVGIVLFLVFTIGFTIFVPVDAFLLARRCRNAPLKSYQRWWVYPLMFLAFIAGNQAAARMFSAFVAEAFVVPNRAMSPAIQHLDRVLVDKLWFDAGHVKRNDVVVFYSEGPGSPFYVMRIVGLPNDEIEIRNDRVFINDSEWEDPHGVVDGPVPKYFEEDVINHGPIVVPQDCCFVLGDNRHNARDSRFLGPIPLTDLYGQARFIYWSRDYTFPDPYDRSSAVPGQLRWDRIGMRLDR